MTETISYKDIVKLIHPDHNPNIVDSGGKMRDAALWRKDESILYKLGVQWGVITPKVSTPWSTASTFTPSPSAAERAQALRTKRYQDLVKAQQAQAAKDAELKKAQEKRKERKEDADVYAWRVKNRVFQAGDVIYIRTRKAYFVVTRQTPLRVYFNVDGKETFSLKKNVRHSKQA